MRREKRKSWGEYFMEMALLVAERSNCTRRHTGSILVHNNQMFASGYNGTPKGLKNCDEGGCPRCASKVPSGKELEDCLCSHAEENAIVQSAFLGIQTKGATLYCTLCPCTHCTKMVINSGIKKVVFLKPYSHLKQTSRLFAKAGISFKKLTLS